MIEDYVDVMTEDDDDVMTVDVDVVVMTVSVVLIDTTETITSGQKNLRLLFVCIF